MISYNQRHDAIDRLALARVDASDLIHSRDLAIEGEDYDYSALLVTLKARDLSRSRGRIGSLISYLSGRVGATRTPTVLRIFLREC